MKCSKCDSSKVFEEIIEERLRQNEKWGEQNHSPIEWISILTEEVGESAKEANDFCFESTNESLNRYRQEMIQVAAVAVQAIECLDRKRWMEYIMNVINKNKKEY